MFLAVRSMACTMCIVIDAASSVVDYEHYRISTLCGGASVERTG